MTGHRLNSVEVELEVDDAAFGQRLIERVSSLRERRLAPVLDRVLCELSGPERVDRIDSLELELELGPIALDQFDDGFVRKLEAALRSALTGRLRRARGPAHRLQSALELVEVFARTGNLPWWANIGQRDLVAKQLRALAEEAAHELRKLLRELAGDDRAIERIARSCDERLIETLIERSGGTQRLPLARALREATPDAGQAVARRKMLLHAIAEFRASLGQPSADRAIVVEEESRRSTFDLGNGGLVDDLSQQYTVSSAQPNEPLDEPRSRVAGPHRGSLRDSTNHAPSALLRRPMDTSTLGEHLTPGADETPAEAESRVASLSPNTPPGSKGQSRSTREAPRSADHSETDTIVPRLPTGQRPEPCASVERARRRAFEGLEQLYVEDAGLVILWPFLDRFFQRVGLADCDHRFIDAQAPMRAIALLEQLAKDDPDPPEFSLALAKLLCGQAPDAPYALLEPLAPEQLAECDNLLRGVIDQVPILHDTSSASFRATFLQRAGVLTTHNGVWLLRVQREVHDVVLERFGWSWSWVKLPWMPEPLQVEW